jgi:N-acetyl-gamma-glutamyl-phosphate reductase
MSAVRGSNYCDIGGFEVDEERNRAVIISVIDNLVKGASGQAVQNMNIMMGFDETEGLDKVGLHP